MIGKTKRVFYSLYAFFEVKCTFAIFSHFFIFRFGGDIASEGILFFFTDISFGGDINFLLIFLNHNLRIY